MVRTTRVRPFPSLMGWLCSWASASWPPAPAAMRRLCCSCSAHLSGAERQRCAGSAGAEGVGHAVRAEGQRSDEAVGQVSLAGRASIGHHLAARWTIYHPPVQSEVHQRRIQGVIASSAAHAYPQHPLILSYYTHASGRSTAHHLCRVTVVSTRLNATVESQRQLAKRMSRYSLALP